MKGDQHKVQDAKRYEGKHAQSLQTDVKINGSRKFTEKNVKII